jgi:CheY-like chemotaxis protein
MTMAIEVRVLPDSPRHKILCVDDETQVLEGLSLQLGRRYEVLTALSGAEALRRCRYCSAKIASRC